MAYKKYAKKTKKMGAKGLTAQQKKAVDKEVVKMLKKRVEPKGYDSSASAILLGNTTNYIQNLTPLAQGTDINQRIGNKVRPYSIYLRAVFSGALNSFISGPFSTSIRMMIVQDMNEDGIAPVAGDILSTGNNTVSHLNWENSIINKRFKVLFDKLFQLGKIDDSTGTSTSVVTFASNSYLAFTKYIKLNKASPVCYSGTNNTSPAKGQIFLFVFSDTNTDRPTMNYSIRFKYQDI